MDSTIDAAKAYGNTPQHDYLSALESAYSPCVRAGEPVTVTHRNGQDQSVTPAVVISLSPEAKGVLSKAQIALQLMTRASPNANGAREPAIKGDNGETSKPASSLMTSTVAGQPAAPTLEQIRSMSAADWFYSTTNVQDFTCTMTPDKAASFEAAYNSKTLNIQRASDVPQLNYQDSWTYTASSAGSGMSSTFSFDSVWAGQTYGSQSFVQSDPLFGGILVSWGDSSESSAS